jgi:hypothetical protein
MILRRRIFSIVAACLWSSALRGEIPSILHKALWILVSAYIPICRNHEDLIPGKMVGWPDILCAAQV